MYSSNKVLQEIVYLLSLNNNRMNLLKLMKELYLIDRASIDERESSVSNDIFVSMPHGPVLSQTLNMLYDLPNNKWSEHLDKVEARFFPDIQIKKSMEFDCLSPKDCQYIQEISKKFKDASPRELENYTHALPEWTDPNGSSAKIRFRDVMKALGKTDEEIMAAKKEYENISDLQAGR